MNRNRELYEILSRHQPHRTAAGADSSAETVADPPSDAESTPSSASGPAVETPSAVSGPTPQPHRPAPDAPPRRRKDGTDLVLGIDAALLIFLVVAVMMYTAYHLGRRSGEEDMMARLRARMEAEEQQTPRGTPSGRIDPGVREERRAPPTLRADTYVLRLASHEKTDRGRAQASEERAYAAARELVRTERLGAYVIEADGAYMVCVGPLESRNSPLAERLMRAFRALPGPDTVTGRSATPYAGAYLLTVGELGRVVE